MTFWPASYRIIVALVSLRQVAAQSYPNVTLPWGTYQASAYDSDGDFYTFSNVRFDPTVLVTEEGASCYGVEISECNTFGVQPSLPGLPRASPETQGEDCLFADIYVPSSALQDDGTKLPIVVWLYGGAFIFGSKDAGLSGNGTFPFYDPTGLMRMAYSEQSGDFIFMTGNYRLGAFGWLAGPTMEDYAAPNAGLWDQRLLLQFASDYLPAFGGDASNIAVWGESAGAGSIVHHLTSTEPAVFTRALMQSPAYMWQWDRSEQGHAAELDDATLQQYNEDIICQQKLGTGLIPFNPAVDGKLITQLPTTALAKRGIQPGITSFIVSHVFDEGGPFVPKYIVDEPTFDRFLGDFFPGPEYVNQRQNITERYSSITNFTLKAAKIISDSSFLCNSRFVFDAYNSQSKMYMMQYDYPFEAAAVHASDLIPTYLNSNVTDDDFYTWFVNNVKQMGSTEVQALLDAIKLIYPTYQYYLATFAGTGTPMSDWPHPTWNVAQPGQNLGDVMQVAPKWNGVFHADSTDDQNTEDVCGFWLGIAQTLNVTRGNATAGNRWRGMDHEQMVFKEDL